MEQDEFERIARRFACSDWPMFEVHEPRKQDGLGNACFIGAAIILGCHVIAAIYWSLNAPPV